ncbi:MAG TPA: response regulator [Myxococcota bacterium]|nr:response regulator [Myxococcota bacterium]
MADEVKKVLLVDDDPMVLAVVASWLENAGYEVLTHDRGLGTIQLLLDHKPQALLIDVNMPLLSGNKLAEMIRGKIDDVTVILHSSNNSASLQQLVLQTNAVGAIQKTGDENTFMTQFQGLLTGRRG